MELVGSLPKQLVSNSFDIEIEDDAPKRKPSLEEMDALEEVRLAIEYIVIPGGEAVELLPRCSEIIAGQLELVESYQLAAENSDHAGKRQSVFVVLVLLHLEMMSNGRCNLGDAWTGIVFPHYIC